MIVYYYDGQLEKDDNKEYYLFKRVSTKDTLFLYYKSKEKTKDEIEKELYFHEFLNILPVAAKKIDKMGFEKTVYKLRKNCSREQFEAFAEAVKTVITEEDE